MANIRHWLAERVRHSDRYSHSVRFQGAQIARHTFKNSNARTMFPCASLPLPPRIQRVPFFLPVDETSELRDLTVGQASLTRTPLCIPGEAMLETPWFAIPAMPSLPPSLSTTKSKKRPFEATETATDPTMLETPLFLRSLWRASPLQLQFTSFAGVDTGLTLPEPLFSTSPTAVVSPPDMRNDDDNSVDVSTRARLELAGLLNEHPHHTDSDTVLTEVCINTVDTPPSLSAPFMNTPTPVSTFFTQDSFRTPWSQWTVSSPYQASLFL